MSHYLYIEVLRHKDTITTNQTVYTDPLFASHQMFNYNPAHTPMMKSWCLAWV